MYNAFLIFAGSGLGGILRYALSNFIHLFLNKNFPYGTLIVNISGCFLMGLLIVLLDRISHSAYQYRAFLLVGVLGGFTTFSTFSIETINLFMSGAKLNALLNVVLSLCLCLFASVIGIIGGRNL